MMRKSVPTAGKKLDLWDEFYRGIFRDRAEAVIATHVKNGVGDVLSTLDAVRDDLKVGHETTCLHYRAARWQRVTVTASSLLLYKKIGFIGYI